MARATDSIIASFGFMTYDRHEYGISAGLVNRRRCGNFVEYDGRALCASFFYKEKARKGTGVKSSRPGGSITRDYSTFFAVR